MGWRLPHKDMQMPAFLFHSSFYLDGSLLSDILKKAQNQRQSKKDSLFF